MRPIFHLILAASLLPLAAPARAQDMAIVMLSHIEVMPASKNQGAALLRELAAASRKETGVVRFEVLQRSAPSSHFLLVETWKDQAALDAHGAAAHTKAFRDKIKPMLMAPIDDRPCIVINAATPSANTRGAIFVVAHVDVPPNQREKILDPLKVLSETSRKEAGNERYDVIQQQARANHFFTIEAWKDQKAADAHELAAHTKQFRATLVPLTGALYDQRWYKAL
jgi:quinol monooxygenase YgiN